MAATKTFEYTVRDSQGRLQKARIEAPCEAAASQRLKAMNLTAGSIVEVKTSALSKEIEIPGLSNKIGLKDVSVMARQLATMIQSGLSLLRALTILSEQTENKALARKIQDVRSDVETGVALSAALGKHPETFPPIMINMIRAGEVGGFLDNVLVSIAENFEASVKLRGKVRSAMTYPIVVFIVAILAVVGMLLFIVPVFASMYTELGGDLPALTKVLVGMSTFLKWGGGPIAIALILIAIYWRTNKHKPEFREKVEPFYLKVPVFGILAKKIALARFSRNLSAMLRAGVPIMQALDIVGEASGNIVIERASKDVRSE